MHAAWGMTLAPVGVGPGISHTCPNLSIKGELGERRLWGNKGGKTKTRCEHMCVCCDDRGRMEGGTYGLWSAPLRLVHGAVWSLPKWGSRLTPGPHTL